FAPRLMPVQLDEMGGASLKSRIESLGVGVHLSRATQEIKSGRKHRYQMLFADKTALETDLIVFSAGIRPRDGLAKKSGLAIGERGGNLIDEHGRTSDANIYAVGECAGWEGDSSGLGQ